VIVFASTPHQRASLLAYLSRQIGELPQDLVGDMPFQIFGAVKNDRLAGAIIFLNYRRQSMEFHLCGSPGWLTRSDVVALFAYPFVHAGCLRLWCLIRRTNKKARKGVERLGFKVMGVADDEFGEGRDGIVYSMTRADCRWIK
jgi:RimJ/RimL family protein N-acetyltransferase